MCLCLYFVVFKPGFHSVKPVFWDNSLYINVCDCLYNSLNVFFRHCTVTIADIGVNSKWLIKKGVVSVSQRSVRPGRFYKKDSVYLFDRKLVVK